MTTPARRLEPRKSPKQRRGHETRERIVDAAARVFARHGYSAGTTNRIATEAGLSIGSLYQYFPNKDAILVELVRRHIDAGVAMLAAVLDDPDDLPPGIHERIGLFVDLALANHADDPRLHQVLFEEAPRPRALLDELHQLEERTVVAVEAMLRSDPAVQVDDPATAARLVVTAVESLVHRQVSSRSDREELPAFRRELVTMLSRYLTG